MVKKPSARASIFTLLGLITRPGPAPKGLKRCAVCVGLLLFAALALMLFDGFRTGQPGKHFNEWRLGTYLNVGLLLYAAANCVNVWRAARAPADVAEGRRFWLLLGLVLLFLGVDDLLRIHEHIDFAIHALLGWDPQDPTTTNLDNMILASYALAPAALAWCYRDHLRFVPWCLVLWVGAAGCAGLMLAGDFGLGPTYVEESIKTVGTGLIVLSIMAAELHMRGISQGSSLGLVPSLAKAGKGPQSAASARC